MLLNKLAIISKPNEFGLGKGACYEWFQTGCLAPVGLSLEDCTFIDIAKPALPPNITHVMLIGEEASPLLLDKVRGNISLYNRYPSTNTFHPQSADFYKEEKEEDDTSLSEKDYKPTKRSNYRFWIRRDTFKLFNVPPLNHPFKYIPQPNLQTVIKLLDSTRNSHLYIDIECRRLDHVISCVGIATATSPVYVIPFYLYNDQRAYSSLPLFLRSLSLAMCSNTIVAHNSMFDLFILAHKYRVPSTKNIYDTMLANHRIFPEAEKDLGHTISLWTNLPFHKDTNVENPRNRLQQDQHWLYNAKDVYATREVHLNQLKYLESHPELVSSVAQANRCIHPYLAMTLKGINVDEYTLKAQTYLDAARITQLERVAKILSGVPYFNPCSPKQCVDYFHKKLNYDVMSRTNAGAPSLGSAELYKLRLKYPNPLIDVISAHRSVSKEKSMLGFTPYEMPNF